MHLSAWSYAWTSSVKVTSSFPALLTICRSQNGVFRDLACLALPLHAHTSKWIAGIHGGLIRRDSPKTRAFPSVNTCCFHFIRYRLLHHEPGTIRDSQGNVGWRVEASSLR